MTVENDPFYGSRRAAARAFAMPTAVTAVSTWLVVAAVFALPPLGVLAHKALAPLALLTALAALPLLHATRWRAPRSMRILALPAIAALAWCWASALWSIDPGLALARAAKLTGITVIGAILFAAIVDLPEPRRCQVGAALVFGVAAALLLITIDLALGGGLRQALRDVPSYYGMASLNNGTTLVVLLVGPAIVWLWRFGAAPGRAIWRWLAPVPVAVCVYLLMNLESQSAAAAFAAGAVTFVVVAAAPKIIARLMAVGVAVVIMAAPSLVLAVFDARVGLDDKVMRRLPEWFDGLSSTTIHRLYIWDFSVERILERPLLGWGLDSSRVMPGRDVMITEVNSDLPPTIYGQMQVLPLHPHNAPLQIWLELGLPGAVLFALISGGLLYGVAGRTGNRLGAGVAAAVLVMALALSSMSYGIWQTWWLAALWFAAALTAVTVRRPANK